MDTKPLLYGLTGFFIGGLIVAVAATTFDKPSEQLASTSSSTPATMDQMSDIIKDKYGDEFDKIFISQMIVHHQGAVEMAKMAGAQAKHEEIKQLSSEIIIAQEKEIGQMQRWQKDWGYETTDTTDHIQMSH